jgi:hypothetical protein
VLFAPDPSALADLTLRATQMGTRPGMMTVHPLSEPVPKTTNFRQGESERPTMETLRFGRRMTAREVEGDAGSSSEDEGGGDEEEPKATGTKFGTWDGVGAGLAFLASVWRCVLLGALCRVSLGSFVAWLCRSWGWEHDRAPAVGARAQDDKL